MTINIELIEYIELIIFSAVKRMLIFIQKENIRNTEETFVKTLFIRLLKDFYYCRFY